MNTTDHLPDYREQSPEVAARFAKIKERPVVLEIDHLGRQFAGDTARSPRCVTST
jgi:hypothetical protein